MCANLKSGFWSGVGEGEVGRNRFSGCVLRTHRSCQMNTVLNILLSGVQIVDLL